MPRSKHLRDYTKALTSIESIIMIYNNTYWPYWSFIISKQGSLVKINKSHFSHLKKTALSTPSGSCCQRPSPGTAIK